MDIIFYIFFANLISQVRPFFLHGAQEPLLFCVKVCPLYCSPRRSDEDVSSLIYVDHPWHLDHGWRHEIPYHYDPYFFCKPPKPTSSTTTTTPKPTTTTEEPSYICMVCMKKCSKILK